jgi:hypothetical protein
MDCCNGGWIVAAVVLDIVMTPENLLDNRVVAPQYEICNDKMRQFFATLRMTTCKLSLPN